MASKLQALKQNDFLWHNTVFFFGSMVVAALNYLYHPILSRIMSIEQFGETQTLFAVLTQASIVMGVFGMIALNMFTNPNEANKRAFKDLYTLAFYLMTTVSIALIIASPLLMRELSIQSFAGIIIIALITFASTFSTFGTSSLRADKEFAKTSFSGIISAGGKLVFAILFVWLGFGVAGAMAGLLIASLLTLAYIWHKTYAIIGFPQIKSIVWDTRLRKELLYGGMIFFTTGFVTFLYTADIIIVKHFFSPEVAGFYSGIAVVARIIFFITGSVAGVLLSHIKQSHTNKENKTYLVKAIKLTILISGGGLIVMAIAPQLVIHLLIGERYLPYASILPILALHTFFIGLINLFVSYAIALRHSYAIYISILGIVLMTALAFLFHDTLQHLIYGFLVTGALTLALFAILCFNYPFTIKKDQ